MFEIKREQHLGLTTSVALPIICKQARGLWLVIQKLTKEDIAFANLT